MVELLSTTCSQKPAGVLKKHEEIEINVTMKIAISLLTCVDTGASIFDNREDSIVGHDASFFIMAKNNTNSLFRPKRKKV